MILVYIITECTLDVPCMISCWICAVMLRTSKEVLPNCAEKVQLNYRKITQPEVWNRMTDWRAGTARVHVMQIFLLLTWRFQHRISNTTVAYNMPVWIIRVSQGKYSIGPKIPNNVIKKLFINRSIACGVIFWVVMSLLRSCGMFVE